MNIIKRAKAVLLRQLGKTISLLILIFIIGVVISGAISVQNAILRIDDSMRRNMKPIVSLDVNGEMLDAYWEEFGESPLEGFLTADIVREIAALSYVDHFVYSVEVHGLSRDLMSYYYERDATQDPLSEYGEGITLHGTSTPEMIQLNEGLIEITHGRTFFDSEITKLGIVSPVIISERFANLNQITLGSMFTLDVEIREIDPDEDIFDPHWIPKEMPIIAKETFEFEVIGMFDVVNQESFENFDLHEDEREMLLSRERDRVNQLLGMVHVPNNVAEVMQQFESKHRIDVLQESDAFSWMTQGGFENRVSAMMLLHDPLDIDDFITEAEPLLPSEFWQVSYLTNDFDQVATAMEDMRKVAQWLLLGSTGATVLILGLLIGLFLYDRKHEMGIYLALGEKKIKIVMQVFVEVITITLIAMSLAFLVGNRVSDVMAREMLRMEVLMPREREWNNTLMQMGFMQSAPDIYPEELMEIFDVSLNISEIAIVYMVGLGTATLSMLIPVLYIVRMNPKKILM